MELTRFSIPESEVLKLKTDILVSRILLFRLFVYKQTLIGLDKNSYQLKTHIISHTPEDIKLFGSHRVNHVGVVEVSHKRLKKIYNGSSKRISNLCLEMFQAYGKKKIFERAYLAYCEVKPNNSVSDNRVRSIKYAFEEDPEIVITLSRNKNDYEELVFNSDTELLAPEIS